jgi:hypothetical protein
MKMAMELAAAAAVGATGCPRNLCCNKTHNNTSNLTLLMI